VDQLHLHCPEERAETPDAAVRAELTRIGLVVLQEHTLPGVIDVVLTGDEKLQELNAGFRGIDRPTDVLSFSMTEGQPLMVGENEEDPISGEIYVSLDRAQAQAAEINVGVEEELGRLIIHGLLHLAGYDHDTEETLRFMENETERFLDMSSLAHGTTHIPADRSCPGGQPHEEGAPPLSWNPRN
jgi:probable rRNA maturation factor